MSASGNIATFRLISLVIVGVLGLQSFAVLARTGKWTWRFIDYPMYSDSRQDGDRIVARYFVFGTTADGREVAIEPRDLGVVLWVYQRWAAALWKLGQDSGDAAGRDGLAKEQSQLPTVQSRRPWPLRDWLKSTALFKLLKSKEDPDLPVVLTDHLQKVSGLDLVKLRIEDTPVIVTRSGQAPAPPRSVEVELPLPAGD